MIVGLRLSCQFLRRIRKTEVFRSEYFPAQRIKTGIGTKRVDFRVDVQEAERDGTLFDGTVEFGKSSVAHSEGVVQQRHVIRVDVFRLSHPLDFWEDAQGVVLPPALA